MIGSVRVLALFLSRLENPFGPRYALFWLGR